MYYPKQCRNCGGNLAYGSNQYRQYVSCMECGWENEVNEPTEQSKPFIVLYHKGPCKGAIETRDYRGWLCTSCGAKGDFQTSRDEVFQGVVPEGFVSSPPNLQE